MKSFTASFRKALSRPKVAAYLVEGMILSVALLSINACINGDFLEATTTFGMSMILWSTLDHPEKLTQPITSLKEYNNDDSNNQPFESIGFIIFIFGLIGGAMKN